MPTNRVFKTFCRWLKYNKKRFNYQPYICFSNKRLFVLRFTGISPRIFAVLDKRGGNFVEVSRNGEMWDGLAEFDAYYDRRLDGKYFCKLCIESELFPSREELLVRHSWEPMMEWLNNSFSETIWVCLYGTEDGGSTWAYLEQESDLEQVRISENYVEAFPLVVRK